MLHWHKRRMVLVLASCLLLTSLLYLWLHEETPVSMDYLDVPLMPNARMGTQRHFRFLRKAERAQCSPYGQTLVVYVHSAPHNARRRRMVRQTWGGSEFLGRAGASLVFVLGTPRSRLVQAAVDTESRKHGDILQADFTDSYRNLTLKAVAALQWVSENCPKARYVLKADDDILVDVVQLSEHLTARVDTLTGGQGVLLCNLWTGNYTLVERSVTSKWRVSPEEFPDEHYPVFCQGAAFVLSADVAHSLYAQSRVTPYFRLDDVYVTGFLRERAGVGAMPLNEAYFTGAQKLAQLSTDKTVRPLFFELHDKETFYLVWSFVKDGKCCPPIKTKAYSQVDEMHF